MNTTRLLSAHSILGTDVRNVKGKGLGDIKELMIDTNSGIIEYVVLSFGGLLGIGDKYFAVPWKSFKIDQENEEFVLDVTEERLKNAPGFDKDNWPTKADTRYFDEINEFYGHYVS